MSKTVRDIANGIVLREGGFVNVPDDLGGQRTLVSQFRQCSGSV